MLLWIHEGVPTPDAVDEGVVYIFCAALGAECGGGGLDL